MPMRRAIHWHPTPKTTIVASPMVALSALIRRPPSRLAGGAFGSAGVRIRSQCIRRHGVDLLGVPVDHVHL